MKTTSATLAVNAHGLPFIDYAAHRVTVTAESPMRVLVFDAPTFASAVDDPAVARAVMGALAARLRSSTTNYDGSEEQ